MAYASSHKESVKGREHRQKQDVTAQQPQTKLSPVLKHFLSIQYFFRENTVVKTDEDRRNSNNKQM